MLKIKAKEAWLLFYGLVIAFLLQVIYDESGTYPVFTQKFLFGSILFLILAALLIVPLFLWKNEDNSDCSTKGSHSVERNLVKRARVQSKPQMAAHRKP